MPGTMIHLMLAKLIEPNGSDLFYLGNIAPDAVPDWKVKEKTHFRDLTSREEPLINLAKNANDDFSKGMLLHLFFDYKWDTQVLRPFANKIGEEWFKPYRKELSDAGSYFYHKLDWASDIWQKIDNVKISDYGIVPSASDDDLKHFVHKSYVWHRDTIIPESYCFSDKFVNDFVEKTANEYKQWLETIKDND